MSEFIYNFNFVGIPSDFIENIMPKTNGTFVKIYLYAINAASKGLSLDYSQIASALDLLESDVLKAFEFFEEKGCVSISEEKVTFEAPQQAPKASESNSKKYTGKNVKQLVTEDKELSDLCLIAQDMLEKTLSDKDIETLYWFYDNLGFTPEVITMLLEYCVSIEKRNMKYIEKVAISWHENNIITVDAAEKYMKEKKEKNSYFGNMKRLLGIDDRNLSKTEETYLKVWKDEYNMSEDMIALAYEYCIIQISKLSFPYMNSIIERWSKNGITTITDAEKDKENFKNGKDGSVYKDKTNFDYERLDEMMKNKYEN